MTLATFEPAATRPVRRSLRVRQHERQHERKRWNIAPSRPGSDPAPTTTLTTTPERFIDLYDLAPVGCLTVNDAGVIQSANRAAAHLLGAPRRQILQQPFSTFVQPKDQALFDRYRERLFATGAYRWSDLHLLRATGEAYWARLDAVVDRSDAYAEPVCLFVITDMSRQQQAEQELLESQELLSLFIGHAPIYAYIKEVTATASRVVHACDRFQELIGIAGPDMVGKTMPELFPAEFAEKMTTDDRRVVTNGKVVELDETLNGRHYATIKFPVLQGNQTLLAGYTIDVSARYHLETAWPAPTRPDDVTSMINRQRCVALAHAEIRQVLRLQHALALTLIDIDDAKQSTAADRHTAGVRASLVPAEVCRRNICEIDSVRAHGRQSVRDAP